MATLHYTTAATTTVDYKVEWITVYYSGLHSTVEEETCHLPSLHSVEYYLVAIHALVARSWFIS